MICVIYGDEVFLMERKLEALKKQYQCNDTNMNFSLYQGDNCNMEEVYEDLMTPSFFQERKMVVLKNPSFLTNKKEKKENQDSEIFLKCLQQDMDQNIFVIFCNEKFDERKKIVKELRKKANFYEVEKVNHYKLAATARSGFVNRNTTIDDDALELLLARVGNNLIEIRNEVEKLSLYTKHVDIEAVEKLVSKPLEENVFDLATALLQKDRKRMFLVYQDLMIQKEEPVKLIILIANQIRLIYQVRLLDRKGYQDKEIAKILAINPYRLKYIRKEGNDFDLRDLLQCLDELSKLDIQIKTGKLDKEKGLELFLLKI